MMKLVLLAALSSVALGGSDWQMTHQWQKMKAMESCWGEENMKLHTVAIKKAIAKCSNEDAPELSLPPYRSAYRFVNTMITKADDTETMEQMFSKMMSAIMEMKSQHHGNYRNSYRPTSYSQNHDSDSMDKMDMMKMMMKMMMKKNMMEDSPSTYNRDNSNNFDMMDMFQKMMSKKDNEMDFTQGMQSDKFRTMLDMFKSRSKRQTTEGNLDLGDRLVEKLADQRHQMEAKIGNMTCVFREMKCLDDNNEIDLNAMKADIKNYELPSEWFGERYEEILDTCYETATNLPANLAENSVITISGTDKRIKIGEIKAFMKCCSESKTKLCMNQDIKKKVEENFGPIEEILKETQLNEYEFFPLVIQLLHGKEMDYMTGDY